MDDELEKRNKRVSVTCQARRQTGRQWDRQTDRLLGRGKEIMIE